MLTLGLSKRRWLWHVKLLKRSQLKYHVAAELYRQAIDMVTVSIVSAASQHQDSLEDLADLYKARLTSLEAVRPELSVIKMNKVLSEQQLLSDSYSTSQYGSPNQGRISKNLPRRTSLSVLPFVENAGRSICCESPPRSIHRRPYWLLRVLKTVLNNGGWLTPAVFVPSDVWRQNGMLIL